MSILVIFMIASIAEAATCRVGAPIPPKTFHRGMYVSLYASKIGTMSLTGPLIDILGNTTRENTLLTFAINHGIDSFSFYDLNTILASSTRTTNLNNFILAAKACGVAEINAIGFAQSDFASVNNYQSSHTGKFDGLVTEVEFWNAPSGQVGVQFQGLISLLQYMKGLGMKNAAGTPVIITSYIGWLNRDPNMTELVEARILAQNVDRIFMHCYVKDASTAYGYCQDRISALGQSGFKIQLYPIFSSEGAKYNAGSGGFMGDWLAANGIPAAETIFNNQYQPAGGLNRTGFQYYEYSFLKLYLIN